MKICVVIPTYNEAKSIKELVRKIRNQNLDVVVIDDGSYDNTFKIAQEAGALVLRNQNNQGKGAMLIKGFNYALSRDYDVIITMDGDGQHRPEEIPDFIRLAETSEGNIFIGNRMSKYKNMPLLRVITNHVMSWLISKIAKQKIPDSQSGFRLIKKEVLKKVKFVTSKYETESELLIRASRLGFKIESIPIQTIYRGEKSQINPFIDTLRFIWFIIRELWTTQY